MILRKLKSFVNDGTKNSSLMMLLKNFLNDGPEKVP